MCGIIGYSGKRDACPIIIKGLKRLEYRGYDSAGLAFIKDNKIELYKKAGKVNILKSLLESKNNLSSNIGIGHTRWATHGEVNDTNAHPHLSNSKNIAIIHNGVIENYLDIKKVLTLKGYKFHTQTDTEVLVNLIEEHIKNKKIKFEEAIRTALNKIEGQYAIAILSKQHPSLLIAARKGAPLAIGIGDNEFFIASDITPIIEHTKKTVYLEDYQMAIIDNKDLNIISIKDNKKVKFKIQNINTDIENIEKGDFEYYMLKEINEQPKVIKDCLNGFINQSEIGDILVINELKSISNKLINAKRIIILACGSSLNAATFGKYIIEKFCKIPVIVEQASEFKYRDPIIYKEDIVIGISQSGETADTLGALQLVKQFNTILIGICNVPNSSMTRLVDVTLFTNAGPEIGVASTKALITQIVTLIKLTLWIGEKKKQIDKNYLLLLLDELNSIDKNVQKVLELNNDIEQISLWLSQFNNALFLGRGYSYPIALEGALKLKEISYIHAEGYAAAEMKHGPIALIDEDMPIVYIASDENLLKKNLSNIEEIKARKGKIIAIISEEFNEFKYLVDYYIELPKSNDLFMPILSTVAVQLLSYYTAIARNCNVDMPKNLAKSVTVE